MGRNTIDKTGEENINNFGSEMIIVEYRKYSDIDVSNYTLIHYEGWGQGGLSKVIIKNTPIN